MRTALSLLALVLLFAAPGIRAQTLGVRGGVTVASASIDDVSGTFEAENRTGYAGGVFLRFGSDVIALQPELNAYRKGTDLVGPSTVIEVETTYLEPALLLRVGIPLGPLRPGVFAGIGVGFEAGCAVRDVSCDDTDFEIHSADPNGILGADLALRLGASTSLLVDARYGMGLRDIQEAGELIEDLENRSWHLQAGVGFHFGGSGDDREP